MTTLPIHLFILGATAFAALSPILFIAIREAVKRQRQEVVRDLAAVFDIAGPSSQRLIPSFEFVKYKYFVGRPKVLGKSGSIDASNASLDVFDQSRHREDFTTIDWILGSVAFSLLAGVAVFHSLSLLVTLLCANSPSLIGLDGGICPKIQDRTTVWLFGACAAFAGSYLTALRNLYRAIKNFDLSPATIIGETIKIVIGIVLAPILVIGLLRVAASAAEGLARIDAPMNSPLVLALAVTGCFVAGIMPDVVLRNILQRDKLKNFKREEYDVYRAFKITPVEIIDGIDSEIRVRLDDHHIHSTQNLATANPLMLFVETPYGVYQIMDWVAQAQLCCSVGREKVIRLWPLGVRTLFDLERLAAPSAVRNEALLLEVGRIILGGNLIDGAPDRQEAVDLVVASIELRLDDPHVQRLRQIFIAVGDRLGPDCRRFRNQAAGATASDPGATTAANGP
ncbi:hypothetical protein ASF49_01530 [Methylobacterium sp. Leaf104]|uniref:hypothetical protein n=1 Tax=Methylobacterium TaxID=407 RepID=UPI0007162CF0|nr:MULTISPECIES: hypothetical protein [Methylobacterium]KQP42557.1 hypothetical protein ASF49_01530 [Methylobacterium sp. Leaf104]MCI9878897.1 hypothetical protein [Methylobacterium goesingense]